MSKAASGKGRPAPRLLTVVGAHRVTPSMIRVTLGGAELEGFPEGREGGNCKLFFPEAAETIDAFARRIDTGQALVRRTFTVRNHRPELNELDIDFVDHGDTGPASRWARQATAGDCLAFIGASAPKVTHFEADWYLIAADLSALPMAAATLEAMPRDAKGIAVFEVPSANDRQDIQAPTGIELFWLVHSNPTVASSQLDTFVRGLHWPEGRAQICIAGESSSVKTLRAYASQVQKVARGDIYASGYWKIGMLEDEHQEHKKAQAQQETSL